jgi:DnaK suppressor protein
MTRLDTTPLDLDKIRIILQNKRAELTYGNRGRGALAVEPTADEMDQTQGGQERDLAVGTLNRDAKLLSDVRSALERIEERTFGVCVDCDSEISVKRLTAVPWAACCIACQESADKAWGQPWNDAIESLPDAA